MAKEDKALYFGLAAIAIIASVTIIGINSMSRSFSEYQTVVSAQQAYERCKEKAPEGMDCIMLPMMVSNNVAQELGRERR